MTRGQDMAGSTMVTASTKTATFHVVGSEARDGEVVAALVPTSTAEGEDDDDEKSSKGDRPLSARPVRVLAIIARVEAMLASVSGAQCDKRVLTPWTDEQDEYPRSSRASDSIDSSTPDGALFSDITRMLLGTHPSAAWIFSRLLSTSAASWVSDGVVLMR